jgi:hypothetical protein
MPIPCRFSLRIASDRLRTVIPRHYRTVPPSNTVSQAVDHRGFRMVLF